MASILCTGGCGYIGSVLVPKLLAAGHAVRVIDACWFGNHLPDHPKLEVIKGDIREMWPVEGMDAVIHLAAIANDPCGELDARLTWEVNVLATQRLAEAAVKEKVKKFIYASSGSVYGIKDNVPVDEDASLEPVSDYNKTKMVAERVLKSYDLPLCILRPATVCGMSPRMRIDTVVNMLSVQALRHGKITAHCGAHGATLMRPNIHIEDMARLYVEVLDAPWAFGTYNACFENLSIGEIAKTIEKRIGCDVEFSEVPDKRSYCVDSSKLLTAGFRPEWNVLGAVLQIKTAWKDGWRPGPESVNLAWMRSQGLVKAF